MTLKSICTAAAVALCSLASYNSAFAATNNEVVRHPGAPNIRAAITQDVMREETYMGSYQEEVERETEEAYTEDIPYTELETYTEYVTSHEYQYKCEMQTTWEEQCNGFGKDRVCHRVAKTSPVCRNEMVTVSKPVTKTRLVTKHRYETRYRKVVKKHLETRCCREQTRLVADHEVGADVEMVFPAEAALTAEETESFRAVLVNPDADSSLEIKPVKAIYSYQPVVTKVGPKQFHVVMNIVPTYQAEELAEKTVDHLQITVLDGVATLSLLDLGNLKKVKTAYDLSLLNEKGGEILRAQFDPKGASDVRWKLPVTLKDGAKVRVVLRVHREGVVLSGPVDFKVEQEFTVRLEETYDPAVYMDEDKVGSVSSSGSGTSRKLYFKDDTKRIHSVQTEYEIYVELGSTGPQKVKTFKREQLKVGGDGKILVRPIEDMGFTKAELRGMHWGTPIYVSINVTRKGSRFPNGEVILRVRDTIWTDGY